MRSEVAIGHLLNRAIKQKLIERNEVIVCSKAGFLSFDFREDIEPRTYIDDTYVKTGLFQLNEFVGGCHCLSGPFLKNQVSFDQWFKYLYTSICSPTLHNIILMPRPELETKILILNK